MSYNIPPWENHITKEKVQFYFIIPKAYLNQFKIKFQEVWKNIEIEEVDNIKYVCKGIPETGTFYVFGVLK